MLKQPLLRLEDIVTEKTQHRADYQELLEVLVEFFHFMGFYIQQEKYSVQFHKTKPKTGILVLKVSGGRWLKTKTISALFFWGLDLLLVA